MSLKNLLFIALHTFRENLKQKNFLILLVYIIVLLSSGFLFSMLAPEQEIRVISNLGSSAIEAFAFLASAFIAVKIILLEIETKTLYLLLARPVKRSSYLFGRYLGLLGVAALYIFLMSLALGGLISLKGGSPLLFMTSLSLSVFLKVMIISSAGVLISLISTSQASSFVIITFLWATGHFSSEIRHLAGTLAAGGSAAGGIMVNIVSYIIPNLSALNYKDTFFASGFSPGDFISVILYSILYSGALIFFASAIFENKDL